jgi:hypothetical protein
MNRNYQIERQTHQVHIRYALDQLCSDIQGDCLIYYGKLAPPDFKGLFIQESGFWDSYGQQASLPHQVYVAPGYVVLYGTREAPDIVAGTFFMLTRYEELLNQARDEHGRFPASASVADTYDFLDRPIVDEYREQLSRALLKLFPDLHCQPSTPTVRFTHDLDKLRKSRLEAIVAELKNVLRGRLSGLPGIFYHLFNLRNPADTFGWLQSLEGEGVYYCMTCSEDGQPFDSVLVQDLLARFPQYAVGIHPDKDEPLLATLWQELAVTKARNHFLLFDVKQTWDDMADVGITEDSTLGFADRCGFRCGTCRPFQVFSLSQECVLPLHEYPLLMMDVTLWAYMHLSPAEAFTYVEKYAAQVKKYGGVFVILWHNFCCDEWRWRAVYKKTVGYLRNFLN